MTAGSNSVSSYWVQEVGQSKKFLGQICSRTQLSLVCDGWIQCKMDGMARQDAGAEAEAEAEVRKMEDERMQGSWDMGKKAIVCILVVW